MQNQVKKYLSSGELSKINNDLNGISSVKAGKGLINWLLKLIDIILDERKPSWTRSSIVFIRQYWRLRTMMGPNGTVKYLKACYVLTMQAAGGMKLKSSQSLGIAVSRSSDGLPRIIPRLQRAMIRSGDRKALRIWLSWFSLYRVVEYKSFATLSTITSPGKRLDAKHIAQLPSLLEAIGNLWNKDQGFTVNLSLPTLKMLYKSAPTVSELDFKKERVWKYSASLIGIEQGAVSVFKSNIYPAFAEVYGRLERGLGVRSGFLRTLQAIARDSTFTPGFVGRLGFKQEAAGKVRVFAMVDVWTQWLLGPLHEAIFALLQTFPTDGTFDQHSPVKRLIKLGYSKFWCFDLSAATDRLPVTLQADILDTLVGIGFGQAWMRLLVDREYQVPKTDLLRPQDRVLKSVKYSVGQPMGALSSWGMLALTHHFLVMWSAKKAGYAPGTFTAYAVLGDDIVIANGPVAQQYLILLEAVGVKIGLAKSLVSKKGALEFAKKYFVQGTDCSPVALKEVAAAVGNPTFGVSFLSKYELSIPRMLSVLGYGFRIKSRLAGYLDELPNRVRSLVLGVYSPWGPIPLDVVSWLTLDGTTPSRAIQGSHFEYDEMVHDRLLDLLKKIDKKWPWFLEEHTVLQLKDLKFPKGTRWENASDSTWGVYGGLQGDLLLIGTLQAAVYSQLQDQLFDLADCKKLAMDVKLSRGSVDELLLGLIELEKMIRLFRTPSAIVHADRKSNKIGLGFQIKLWEDLQDFLSPFWSRPDEISDEGIDDSKIEASSGGSTHLSWDELLQTSYGGPSKGAEKPSRRTRYRGPW